MSRKNNSEKEPKRARIQYEVMDPRMNYCGKSYSEWATDWFNWFLSAHADKRTLGPVVFLRSHGLPNHITGAYISDEVAVKGSDTSPDGRSAAPEYQTPYVNDPNIRVGSDKLQIFEDQAVFIPIIIAYQFSSVPPYADWGSLQDYCGLLIDNGDDPPETKQLTINNEDIQLPAEMEEFRVTTPIFTAIVPDAPYGTSIKDFLEEGPIAPGTYQAMVEGYFVMVKFKRPGNYTVHCWASAGREVKGPYFSDLIYEIGVRPKVKRHGMITARYPARNEAMLNRVLNKKKEIGELTDLQVNGFRSIVAQAQKKLLGGP